MREEDKSKKREDRMRGDAQDRRQEPEANHTQEAVKVRLTESEKGKSPEAKGR